jgi:hypothetical protein
MSTNKNINPGFTTRILNDPKQVLNITNIYLCLITIAIYRMTKNEKINPEIYFNKIKIAILIVLYNKKRRILYGFGKNKTRT